jgi:predicted heme/steroid binding protein
MAARLASLMSVPVKKLSRSMKQATKTSCVDYGLLLNRYELARYDGCTGELPVLIAYRGRIYDVTGRKPWKGEVNWRRYAGRDCTAELRAHPRRVSLLTSSPCVGVLED